MTEKEQAVESKILGFPIVEMPRGKTPQSTPGIAYLCELDMKMDAGQLIFHYPNIGTIQLAGQSIEDVVRTVCRNGDRPGNYPGTRGAPRRSSLSLNNLSDAYLIFLLNPNRNWRFSREAPPFSLYAKARPPLTEFYFNPVAVDQNGDPVPVDQDGNPVGTAKSMLAYFHAYGRGPGEGDRFNLHIEIVDPQDASGKRCVPIIIDPDVGHPGGFEP